MENKKKKNKKGKTTDMEQIQSEENVLKNENKIFQHNSNLEMKFKETEQPSETSSSALVSKETLVNQSVKPTLVNNDILQLNTSKIINRGRGRMEVLPRGRGRNEGLIYEEQINRGRGRLKASLENSIRKNATCAADFQEKQVQHPPSVPVTVPVSVQLPQFIGYPVPYMLIPLHPYAVYNPYKMHQIAQNQQESQHSGQISEIERNMENVPKPEVNQENKQGSDECQQSIRIVPGIQPFSVIHPTIYPPMPFHYNTTCLQTNLVPNEQLRENLKSSLQINNTQRNLEMPRIEIPSNNRWVQSFPQTQGVLQESYQQHRVEKFQVAEKVNEESQEHNTQQYSEFQDQNTILEKSSKKCVHQNKESSIEKGNNIDINESSGELGKIDRRIDVLTNHFPLHLGNVKLVYQYNVAIKPDHPKRLMQFVLSKFKEQHFPDGYVAFDGAKFLYSPSPLPIKNEFEGHLEIQFEEDRPAKIFHIKIKKLEIVNLEDSKNATQALEIILRSSQAARSITVGRSTFPKQQRLAVSIGKGMELYRGTHVAINKGSKLFLNVDSVNKAFPKPLNIIDLIKELGRGRHQEVDLQKTLHPKLFEEVQKHIRNLEILYCIPNNPASKRKYRVNNLVDCAKNLTFKKDNTYITVEDYFAETKIKLKYPLMPCIWVGSKTKQIYIPPEFCTLFPSQVVNKKLGAFETNNMIKECTTDTDIRKKHIEAAIDLANFNQDPIARSFDLKIDPKFQEISARVLNAPDVCYDNKKVVKVVRGQWRVFNFWNAANLSSWTVLNMDSKVKYYQVEEFAISIQAKAKQLGLMIKKHSPQKTLDCNKISIGKVKSDLIEYFKEKKKEGLNLIFVIIPEYPPKIYNHVKFSAEISSGCLTQCIKSRNIYNIQESTIRNLLLKVNTKLNGTNHIIEEINPILQNELTMIMGADVTHPGPENRLIPSVAAVTASYDTRAFKYNTRWHFQEQRVELIHSIDDVSYGLLLLFKEKNKKLPEKILFFRDGVSDGDFNNVLNYELQGILSACKKIDRDYKPKITFIIVQKRHHTRFFPKNAEDSEDRNKNVPAGTCVDTEIVNQKLQNFFLVSHASIQGVAKPTKYVVLYDDNNFSNDQIENLTYYLCHMYTRCSKSVSYPAPTYYAHLAAARVRSYIETEKIDLTKLKSEEEKLTIQPCIIKDRPMFFV